MVWQYIVILVLIVFSAFFSASDMIYGIVDKNKLEKEANKGSKNAKRALWLANNYELSISSILFGNNLVNILASSIVTVISVSLNPDNGAVIGTIVFTVILIIFAEFFPKAIAKRFNYSLSKAFAFPTSLFVFIFAIFTFPIAKFFALITKPFKKIAKEEDAVNDEVLDEMIDEMTENGVLENEEAEIVRGAIDLIDIQAYEIMTPRVKLYAFDIEDGIEKLTKRNKLLKYSRIPVFSKKIDNIIGVIPTKTLARAIMSKKEIKIDEIMYKPLYVPRNYQVMDLLNDFKQSKIHIAIVIDEYGGTEGIVTMEDILEEIVGDIFDENDDIKEEVIKENKSTYVVDGSMNLYDFFELIDYHGDFETDFTTVSGLCQELKKEGFVEKDDKFKFENYRLTILEADRFKANKIRVKRVKKR